MDPESSGSRFMNLCLQLLLIAVVLSSAVAILKSIWLWLVLGAVVSGVVAGLLVVLRWRQHHW